jgi:hypothetical protein
MVMTTWQEQLRDQIVATYPDADENLVAGFILDIEEKLKTVNFEEAEVEVAEEAASDQPQAQAAQPATPQSEADPANPNAPSAANAASEPSAA